MCLHYCDNTDIIDTAALINLSSLIGICFYTSNESLFPHTLDDIPLNSSLTSQGAIPGMGPDDKIEETETAGPETIPGLDFEGVGFDRLGKSPFFGCFEIEIEIDCCTQFILLKSVRYTF